MTTKHVKALRLAKKTLYTPSEAEELGWRGMTGRKQFICTALDEVARTTDDSLKGAVRDLKAIIMSRLGDSSTLESWLHAKKYLDLNRVVNSPYDESSRQDMGKIMETRHRWINALISEFK